MGWQKQASGNLYSSRSSYAFVVGMHEKCIIKYAVYSINCNKFEFKPKDDKEKGGFKKDEKRKGGGRGNGIDEYDQDDEQMWTASCSRLRSTTNISDSPSKD